MKLFIKQKVFSLNEKFTVKDEFGFDKYFVEGAFMSFPKQFTIFDSLGGVSARITRKPFSFPARYSVDAGGVRIAEIAKEFTLFNQKFTVDGPNWTVKGDFLSHEYNVFSGNCVIATISKEWFSWGDSYVIYVPDTSNELLSLAVVITIDEVLSRSSSTHHN